MNKTILTIIISTLLGCSLAVPYGEPRRIDELKIPYCLDQVGYKCLVCGYNTETQTPTAPNKIGTACLKSKDGCTQFDDLTGEQCDKTQPCYCGYNRDYWGKCVKKVIDNCEVLEFSGTECNTCVGGSANLGGGLSDYGLSFDAKKCVDNIANGTPWCQRYSSVETVCAICKDEYYLNSMNKCIKSTVGTINFCEVISDSGDKCLRCQYNFMLNPTGTACGTMPAPFNSLPAVDPFCTEYTKAPNGIDNNLFKCVQCAQGYIPVGNPGIGGSNVGQRYHQCVKTQDEKGNFQVINIGDSNEDVLDAATYGLYNCFAFVKQSAEDKIICSIKRDKTSTDPWAAPAATTVKVNNAANFCYDFNESDGTCKTANDCYPGKTYEKNWMVCSPEISTCLPNCKIADGGAWCQTCIDGYRLENGRCYLITPAGCKDLNEDGTCVNCFTTLVSATDPRTYTGYVYDPIAKACSSAPSVSNCILYGENGACTTCDSGFTLTPNNMCAVNIGTTAPQRIYGCLVGDALKCTTPLPGFTCGADGLKCWVIRENCHSYLPTGECDLCIQFNYFKQYDYSLGRYVCTSGATAGLYCDLTKNGCECETCQAGLTLTGGSCHLWNQAGLTIPLTSPPIPGCIKYTSETVCDTCEIGYLKTVDNKCYNLGRTRSWFVETNNAVVFGEPCTAASNVNECTTCDATNFDSGFVSIVGGTNAHANWAAQQSFCVYNLESKTDPGYSTGQSLLSGAFTDYKSFNIPGCLTYTADALAGTTCATANTVAGWSGAAGSEALVHASLGTGFPKLTKLCKRGAFDGTKCTACDQGKYLSTLNACENNISNCLTMLATDGTCTQCAPGYSLDTVLKNFCRQIIQGTQGCSGGLLCAVRTLNWVSVLASSSWSVGSCGTGTDLKGGNCAPQMSKYFPNCATQNSSSNNCEKCAEGFTLSTGDTAGPKASNIYTTKCVPAIKGCTKFNPTSGKCEQCGLNADGAQLSLDSAGNVCISQKDRIQGCSVYKVNDPATCVKCDSGRGAPGDGCKNKDALCRNFNEDTKQCTTCYDSTNFVPNYKGICVPIKYLGNCDVPYNSTTCLSCDTGYTLIRNPANDESEFIGVCATQAISNCLIANEKNTECLRCQNNFANLGGICVSTGGNIPSDCADIRYDVNKKSLYCYECNRGFAIDGNYTTCVLNNHPCSDVSGGKDCYKLDKLVGFEIQAKCADYGRSSSSLIAFSALIAFFLYLVI